MKASMFARMRVNIDAVAFATPSGTLSKARLFVETVEAFEKKKRQPRNLVLILSRGLDAEVFEVFEAPFARVSPLLARAPMSAGERAYWTLDFHKATQRLSDGQGAEVELKKLEKRRER